MYVYNTYQWNELKRLAFHNRRPVPSQTDSRTQCQTTLWLDWSNISNPITYYPISLGFIELFSLHTCNPTRTVQKSTFHLCAELNGTLVYRYIQYRVALIWLSLQCSYSAHSCSLPSNNHSNILSWFWISVALAALLLFRDIERKYRSVPGFILPFKKKKKKKGANL